MNFGEVRRAQLAKSTLLTSTLVPLGSFQIYSDDEERVRCGTQPHLSIPSEIAAWVPDFAVEDLPLTELRPWSLSLQCRTCPWAEYSDDNDDI